MARSTFIGKRPQQLAAATATPPPACRQVAAHPLQRWTPIRTRRVGRSLLRPSLLAAPKARGSRDDSDDNDGSAEDWSTAEFIARESPAKGPDGRLRERPRAASLRAPCVAVSPNQLPTPGARLCLRVGRQLVEQLDRGEGQAVLAVLEEGEEGTLRAKVAASGAYAAAAVLVGSPEPLGSDSFVATFRADRRLAVQALSVDMDGNTYCQAAELPDRWIFFVRASAVEKLAQTPDWTQVPEEDEGREREVKHALRDVLEASSELKATIVDLQVLTEKLTVGASDGMRNEWAEVLHWAEKDASSSKEQRLQEAHKLSFGAFQETPFTQGGAEAVAAMRIKAMELTDLGMRVEDALSYTMGLRRIMRAAAALESLGD